MPTSAAGALVMAAEGVASSPQPSCISSFDLQWDEPSIIALHMRFLLGSLAAGAHSSALVPAGVMNFCSRNFDQNGQELCDARAPASLASMPLACRAVDLDLVATGSHVLVV